jgi:hypothetical protein
MSSYARQQQQIDETQLDNRVMGVLVQHRDCNWNEFTIASHLGYDDAEAILAALKRLRERGWATCYGNTWERTTDGDREYQDEIRRPTLPVSQQEFKREALTGVDSRGCRSKITRAAIPGTETHSRRDNDFVRLCHYVGEIRSIAIQFCITVERTRDMLLSGEIHVCTGEDGKSPHWGRYHRHNGKNGQTWQSKCIECRRKMREK